MGPEQQGESQVGCVPHGPRRGPAATGLVLLALLLAACSGAGARGASPSPSASANPTPSPSSTPVDVVSAFVGKTANGIRAQSSVSGTIDVGTVHGTIEGAYTFGADGSYEYELTTRIGDARSTSSGIVVNGETYAKDGAGPWLLKPAGQPGSSSAPEGRWGDLGSLRDTGVVTRAGTQVHALRAPGGLEVPASALGISNPAMRNADGRIDFYALADGTPAGMTMTVTWQQGTAAAPTAGRIVMDFDFVPGTGSATVAPPDEVWKTFSSKRGYAIAYPADWQPRQDKDGDYFDAPDTSTTLQVASMKTALSQRQWQADSAADITHWLNVRSDGAVAVSVAGIATQAVEYHGKLDGDPIFFVDVPLVHKGVGYDLYWFAIPGYEADDIAQLKTFLASFAFAS